MKLSKQERIAALIVVAVVILALGGFLLIKPKFEAWGRTQNSLDAKQQEYNDDVAKAERKDGLKTEILEAYKDGEKAADMFFPELSAYETDDAFRAFLMQCTAKVVVESVTLEQPATETLGLSFFVPNQVDYPLKSYVLQGSSSSEDSGKIDRQAILRAALGEPQTIGASKIEFTVSAIDPDELIKFADQVNNYQIEEHGQKTRKAMMMHGLAIDYKEITKKYDALVVTSEKDMETAGRDALAKNFGLTNTGTGNEPLPGDNNNDNEQGMVVTDTLYSYTDTMVFFSVTRMEDPTPILNAQDGGASA